MLGNKIKIIDYDSRIKNSLIDKEGRTRLHSIRLYDEHFTLCKRCKAINYYTNKTCVLCNSLDINTDDLHDIEIHHEIIDIYKNGYSTNFDDDKFFSVLNSFITIGNDGSPYFFRIPIKIVY